MWFKISQIILRHRIAILIVLGLLTGMFAYFAATNVKINTQFANTLSPDDPIRMDHDRLKNMFGEDGNIMVIGVEGIDLFQLDNFNAWYKLGQDLKKIDGIDSIFSVAHMYELTANKDDKQFKLRLITDREQTSQRQVDSIRNIVMSQKFYDNILYKKSSNLSLMMVTINSKKFNSLERGTMIDEIYKKTQEYESFFPTLRYSGLPYIRDIVANSVKKELKITVALAALVTAIILFVFYRSLIVVGACLLVVLIGVIWSFGTIGLLDYKLTMIMALLPPLIIVIGIPNCTYLLNKYHSEYTAHGNKGKALSRVIQKIGNATFLTNMTTALGFGTFVFTNSFKMQQFGVVAFINIIAVFLVSICLIPILFSFLKPPKVKHTKHLEKKWVDLTVNRLITWVSFHRKWVYLVTILVVGIAGYGLSLVVTTGNISSDLPKGNPVLNDLRYFEQEFGGVMPFEVLIDAKSEGRVQRKEFVTKLESIQRTVDEYRYKGDKIFAKSMSVADAIKYVNQAYAGGDTAAFNLGLFDLSKRDQGKVKKFLEGPEVQDFKRLRTSLLEENDSIQAKGLEKFNTLFPENSIASGNDIDQSAKNAIIFVNSKIEALLSNGKNLAKAFVDSTGRHTRISFQIADVGTREMENIEADMHQIVDSTLNPIKDSLNYFKTTFNKASDGDKASILAAFIASPSVQLELGDVKWKLESALGKADSSLMDPLYEDTAMIYSLANTSQLARIFNQYIDENIYDYVLTGTSVVFARETTFLVQNLFVSLAIAVVMIAVLMALLFSSIKMVLVSLIPNFIPLLTTAGIMGLVGIPIKPSTVLVFSVAFGISIDDTIHYLAKYRQELKVQSWNIKGSVINALKETGVSMIYTSIVLFFGFSVFASSDFGGTVALGILVSVTLLIAMLSNLVVLPSLLLWLDKTITNKAFKEPFLELIDEEEDIDLDHLEIVKVQDPQNQP